MTMPRSPHSQPLADPSSYMPLPTSPCRQCRQISDPSERAGGRQSLESTITTSSLCGLNDESAEGDAIVLAVLAGDSSGSLTGCRMLRAWKQRHRCRHRTGTDPDDLKTTRKPGGGGGLSPVTHPKRARCRTTSAYTDMEMGVVNKRGIQGEKILNENIPLGQTPNSKRRDTQRDSSEVGVLVITPLQPAYPPVVRRNTPPGLPSYTKLEGQARQALREQRLQRALALTRPPPAAPTRQPDADDEAATPATNLWSCFGSCVPPAGLVELFRRCRWLNQSQQQQSNMPVFQMVPSGHSLTHHPFFFTPSFPSPILTAGGRQPYEQQQMSSDHPGELAMDLDDDDYYSPLGQRQRRQDRWHDDKDHHNHQHHYNHVQIRNQPEQVEIMTAEPPPPPSPRGKRAAVVAAAGAIPILAVPAVLWVAACCCCFPQPNNGGGGGGET